MWLRPKWFGNSVEPPDPSCKLFFRGWAVQQVLELEGNLEFHDGAPRVDRVVVQAGLGA